MVDFIMDFMGFFCYFHNKIHNKSLYHIITVLYHPFHIPFFSPAEPALRA